MGRKKKYYAITEKGKSYLKEQIMMRETISEWIGRMIK